MPIILCPWPPLAVHISEGVLSWPWLALGFVAAAALLAWSARRLHEDEVPRVALLTAVFFVASSLHVKVPATSVHLLLNGLTGMILGSRAVLAIAVGLLLQATLLQHGGFYALGVNTVVIAVPALLARPAFVFLLREQAAPSFRLRHGMLAVSYILHPLLAPALFAGILLVRHFAWRWKLEADFRAGFVVGAMCVLLTAFLNAVVLVLAGNEDWRIVAALVLAAHIPIAFIEGFIVGCTVSFLGRVKPEMLPQST